MSARKGRSRKRSDANSARPPEPILFLDRNLGRHLIAGRLRAAGMRVEVHDDHLPTDAPDAEWIALVGKEDWVAVTKDNNIRYRTAELQSVRQHGARILVLRTRNATAEIDAELLKRSRHRIAAFVARSSAPFVARLDRSGRVDLYSLSGGPGRVKRRLGRSRR